MTSRDSQPQQRRSVAAAAMGNATEWFDYGVYAATATYITHAFFPGLGTAFTMLGFAVSFVLRPVGGMVWGPLGDRIGRKAVLATTILLMAGATACIGILPSHDKIGILAPILLFALRVVQGFSTGGEYGGAATFMAESVDDDRRGFMGSFLEFGTVTGIVGGTALVLALQVILGDHNMQAWGWRIPFLVALPLGLIGWYLRSRLDESEVFTEVAENTDQHGGVWALKALVTQYPRELLTLAGLVIALNITDYTLLTYQPTYLEDTIKISNSSSTAIVLVGQLVMMLVLPASGALSDRVGRRPMWLVSLVGLAVLSLPMFWLMGQGIGWAIVGFVVLGLLFVPQLSTISATFPAIFPTQVRYAGFALSYNLATAIFGGTAPYIDQAVIDATGWKLFPALFMIAGCLVGLVAWCFLRETRGASLRGTDTPATGELAVQPAAS